MDMTSIAVTLLIACLILISIILGLGLGVLLMLRRRSAQSRSTTERIETTMVTQPTQPPTPDGVTNKLDAIDRKLDQHKWLALVIFGGGWIVGIVGATVPDLWHITRSGLVGLSLGVLLLIIGMFGTYSKRAKH